MTNSKKTKWIQAEHDKAVKVHHENIDRIQKLEEKISTNLYRIHYYHFSFIKLERQEKYDKYDLGMDLIKEEQKKLALQIAQFQKDIDSNTKSASWELCQKQSDKDMLAKKYDKLFPKEVTK